MSSTSEFEKKKRLFLISSSKKIREDSRGEKKEVTSKRISRSNDFIQKYYKQDDQNIFIRTKRVGDGHKRVVEIIGPVWTHTKDLDNDDDVVTISNVKEDEEVVL